MKNFKTFLTLAVTGIFLGSTQLSQAQTKREIKKQRRLYNKTYNHILRKIEKNSEKQENQNLGEENERSPEEFFAMDYLKTMDVATGKQHPQKLLQLNKDINNGVYSPASGKELSFFKNKGNINARIDGTNQWIERGPYSVGGRTRAVMFDPNDANGKKVFAGGVSGGLWYNNDITDANSEWKQVSDIWANMTISCIVADPNNPKIFYIGTGESYTNQAIGSGIWKTTDGGTTWSQIFTKTATYASNGVMDGNLFINDIKVKNNNGNSDIYVALGNGTHVYTDLFSFLGANETGLYKSTDGGTNFSKIDIVSGKRTSANSLFISKNGDIYVGTTKSNYGDDTGGKIFKSTDNGATFTQVYDVTNKDARVQVTGSATDNNKIYALMQGTGSGASATNNDIVRIVKSTDGGATWASTWGTNPALTLPKNNESDATSPFDFTRGQSFYDLVISVDPDNDNTVYVGGVDLYRTTDGAATWNPISKWANAAGLTNLTVPIIHADQHAIVFNPKNKSQILFGNDGGLYFAPDKAAALGDSWSSSRIKRYNTTQYYHGQLNPMKTTADEEILAGAQDNGTQQFTGAPITQGTTSTMYKDIEYSGGDGAFVGFDDKGKYRTFSYTNNNIYLVNDNITWQQNNNPLIIADADKGKGHFINEYAVDRNLDILYSVASDNPNLNLFRVSGLATATVDANRKIQGVTQTTLDLGAAQNSETISMIEVSPYTTTSTTLFVGTTKNKLIKITNADTTPVVTTIATPNFVGNVSDIQFGANENTILVTISNFNTKSVWYTTDGGTTWVDKEGNLPDVPVRCAFINPNNPKEVLLGTEVGIYGTTNFDATAPSWSVYNKGIGNIRITNLDYRASDKTLLAVTFGRGVFTTVDVTTPLATQDVNTNKSNIYPNPSEGGAFFFNSASALTNGTVTVYDMSGRLVYQQKGVKNNQKINADLKKGIYFVTISDSDKEVLKSKLIVK